MNLHVGIHKLLFQEKIILYILNKLGKDISRLKLLKILFIIDYISYKLLNQVITWLKWFKYDKGPWNYTVNQVLTSLSDKYYIHEVRKISRNSKVHYVLNITNLGVRYVEDINYYLTTREIEVIDKVVQVLKDMKINEILDLVYNIPEVKYTPYGVRIKFLKHPILEEKELRHKIETEGINIESKSLREVIEEIKVKIERGELTEHPWWERYIELRNRIQLIIEVETYLKKLSEVFNIDLAKPWIV